VRPWRNLCAFGVTCPPLADRLTNNNYLDFDNLLVLKLSFCALDAHHRILHPSMIFKFNSFGVDNLFKRFSY
jgi:hypothetical protein